jgi:dual oxidase
MKVFFFFLMKIFTKLHLVYFFLDSHLTRKVPATYSDGVYMMGGLNRPNPRKLSELFMKGPDGLGSVMNRTALFAFFGT